MTGASCTPPGRLLKPGNRGPAARLQEPADRPDRGRGRPDRVRGQLGRGPHLLMADEVRVSDGKAEEAGEAIHLPAPSFQPVVLAFGLMLAIPGVVISPAISVIGLVIVVVTLYMWTRDPRRETREL